MVEVHPSTPMLVLGVGFGGVAEPVRLRDIENPKARRKATVVRAGEYHGQQLRLLLEQVREGFARLDREEM
jgi:hypothetical protein